MNIIVRCESQDSSATGGGYTVSTHEVFIDPSLPDRQQRIVVIHEIVELFFPAMCHDKIDELTEALTDGLDQLC